VNYLTVATGRDYTDVAPTSGTYLGTARGNLTATKQVDVALSVGGRAAHARAAAHRATTVPGG
jgi:transglutaminase-like putative cysteine protease